MRFVEDNWESPVLGAWGLGWEVWLDGMEVTQFTYFQQVGPGQPGLLVGQGVCVLGEGQWGLVCPTPTNEGKGTRAGGDCGMRWVGVEVSEAVGG